MYRKLTLLVVAAVAVAVGMPSSAAAAEATYPTGTRAPVGQEFTLTGTNTTLTAKGVGPLTCAKLAINVKVTQNDGTTVTASGSNTKPIQETCFNEDMARGITFTNFNVTDLRLAEANGPSGATKNGSMSFTATVDLPAGITCNFTGTNVPFTFVSTASPAVITFNKGGGITSTGGCGSATLDGSFSLHGPGGTTTAVVMH